MNKIARPENLMKVSMKVVMRCSHTTDKDFSSIYLSNCIIWVVFS